MECTALMGRLNMALGNQNQHQNWFYCFLNPTWSPCHWSPCHFLGSLCDWNSCISLTASPGAFYVSVMTLTVDIVCDCFVCTLGMVLVRTEMGQLVMVPQQALAQAQALAQSQAQNNISPRTATPTTGATFRATTPQVRVTIPLSLPQCDMPLVVLWISYTEGYIHSKIWI